MAVPDPAASRSPRIRSTVAYAASLSAGSGERDAQLLPLRARGAGTHVRDTGVGLERARVTAATSAGVGEHDRLGAGAGREVLGDDVASLDRGDAASERVGDRLAQRELGEPEGQDAEDGEPADPHAARVARDPATDAVVGAVTGRLLGAVARHERPEHPATADEEQRGQEGQRGEHRAQHADRTGRAERPLAGEHGGEQAQQAERHRGRRGDDRRARAGEGCGHRVARSGYRRSSSR